MNSTIIQAALWLLCALVAVGIYYCLRPRRHVAQVEQGAGATFCPNCGKQIVSGTQFCGACGNRISETNQTGTEPVSAVVPKRRIGALRLIGGVCGVVLIIVFGSAALFVSAGTSTSKIWTEANTQLAAAADAASSTGTAPQPDSGSAAGPDSATSLQRLLPPEAQVIEAKHLDTIPGHARSIVLWMLHPERVLSAGSCADSVYGDHWFGPTRLSLIDLAAMTIINTTWIMHQELRRC
jgi:hypothetical protein